MELLYLFIGGREKMENLEFSHLEDSPYKVLKDVELNFSNQLIFSLKKKEAKLVLSENNNYVPGFFDKTGKIRSITGIIGKNGTGKSSILDFIISLRKDNLHHHFYKFIAIFGETESGGTHTKFTIYHHPELDFNPTTEIERFKSKFNLDAKVSTKEFDQYRDPFPGHKLIYYSPVFEIRGASIKDAFEVYGDENLENISTTQLLEKDAEYQTNVSTKNMNAQEVIRRHKLMETDRQVQFIYNVENSRNFLDFDPPQILELTIDRFDEQIILSNYKEAYNSLIQAFDNYEKDATSNPKKRFVFQLHRAAFFNTMRYFLDNPIPFEDLNKILDRELGRDMRPEKIRNLMGYLAKGFEDELKRKHFVPVNSISEQLYLLQSLLEAFNNMSADRFASYSAEDTRSYVDLRKQEEYFILEKYFKAVNLTGFLLADWRFSRYSNGEMSSGEKGLISMFSRFYYVYSRAMKFNTKNKSLIILIDEGDQLFHPEWQRKFLSRILKFFLQVYDFADSIQIIMTTHSPFIASDLPPFSIVKLNKDGNWTKVEKVSSEKSTFAANIHELFTDSFYLENGLVGEFAIQKVKEIFARINNSKEIVDSNLDKEVALVGEPFVNMSLTEKLKQRRNNE